MKNILDAMLNDMAKADELFKPTQFWINASKLILDELQTDEDFNNFRNLPISREMFVPSYEFYYYKKHKTLFQRILSLPVKKNLLRIFEKSLTGADQAKNDYRLFLATSTDKYPNLTSIGESNIGNPVEYYSFDEQRYSQGFLNYLRGLNFLKRHADCKNIKRVIELGGGFGTLGEITQKAFKNTFYLNVDIPPVAAVSSYYLSQLLGKENVFTYDQSKHLETIDVSELEQKYKCAVICPWQLPQLQGHFDLFVNFISFQEMEPHIVKNYISIFEKLLNKTSHVLLRNSRFGKKIAKNKQDVGVIDQVTLDFIIKQFKNCTLVDRDYKVFGFYSKKSASEVAILKKNSF
ncbi:putative sugar O-methyltransferase [Desulforhopalus sp. IMCC35007]|uniref:putative sugar O-methyltransferase n=1 Tax=Desulforhopalus sp. IMCC35007 TaxID=2569543 RepID=UPI0010AE0337|nr:putative sugar O-methyltransferase [Desulforhopalus sp. IMCC35007]TKB05596.1 putative sugar O-methyltransferase [Desulforhopalus sp. IMCC35007]